MNFDPINSWIPRSSDGKGLARLSDAANRPTTHREPGHVPVDKADAEKRERAALYDAEKTPFQKIVEKGFSKFMEEMEAEKLKELREKILGAMGLTEEMLSNMSPEQRAIVEKSVAEEIRRRLTAAAEISAQEKHAANPQNDPSKVLSNPISGGGTDPQAIKNSASKGLGFGNKMGLGPLLALQEVEQKLDVERPSKPGQKDHKEG